MIMSLIYILRLIFESLKFVLHTKYKWMLIFFIVWLFRVDFIADTGGGGGKALQIVCLFCMFLLLLKYNKLGIWLKMNVPIKSCVLLYSFGTLSALWAFLPSYAAFMAIQNIVLLLVLIWLFSNFHSFYSTERAFVILMVGCALFETIGLRLTWWHSLIVHHLASGSMSAICISYCVGELLRARKSEKERKLMLKGAILIAAFILITSTSSGANASTVFGIAVALVISGNIAWASLLFVAFIILYFNQDLIQQIIFFIMPGKDLNTIETATGRQEMWNAIWVLAALKPMLGYGYGCIERVISDFLDWQINDAHNMYMGIYGSLGIIGCVIFYIMLGSSLITSLVKRAEKGFCGVVAAFSCAMLNGYSFGYLSGKACSITIAFFALVCLTYYYPIANRNDKRKFKQQN